MFFQAVDCLLVGNSADAGIDCRCLYSVLPVDDEKTDGINGSFTDVDGRSGGTGFRMIAEIPEPVGTGSSTAMETVFAITGTIVHPCTPTVFARAIVRTFAALFASGICVGIGPANFAVILLWSNKYDVAMVVLIQDSHIQKITDDMCRYGTTLQIREQILIRISLWWTTDLSRLYFRIVPGKAAYIVDGGFQAYPIFI